MRTIWKTPLALGRQEIELPEGAEILTVREQRGGISLWATVDTEKPMVSRAFWVLGTGNELPWHEDLRYLGTAQLDGGLLILHTFEVIGG